jgi:hypothetical protein
MHSDGVFLIIQKKCRVLMANNMALYTRLQSIVLFNLKLFSLKFVSIVSVT